MLTRRVTGLIKAVLRLAPSQPEPNPLNVVVRETKPSLRQMGLSEAEMDRYSRYHSSNQHGR